MLKQVAEGVLVHESECIQSNAVVVEGEAGVLLIDPGITGDEMAAIANDLRESGQPVVAGFSTHPDWDHVLWHPDARRRAPLRHGPLRGFHPRSAVERGLGGPASPRGCRRSSPTTSRWTCSVSSPVCPPEPRRFRGMAPRSGSSSIRRMPRAMRRC